MSCSSPAKLVTLPIKQFVDSDKFLVVEIFNQAVTAQFSTDSEGSDASELSGSRVSNYLWANGCFSEVVQFTVNLLLIVYMQYCSKLMAVYGPISYRVFS